MMVSTTHLRSKKGFPHLFLLLSVLVALGCSAGEQEGDVGKPGGHFSFGAAKYLYEIKSRNPMVKKNAIYYLGEKGEAKAVPLLIGLLGPDEPKNIRLSAIIALGKIGKAASADALIQLLKADDNDLRREAIWALGQIKDPKAIPRLAGLLDDANVRLTAIWAMGNIGDKSAVPVLTGLLTDDNRFVRHNAAQSLKKIGNID
jgi:hypothetical protein